jgi:hypothetical protein
VAVRPSQAAFHPPQDPAVLIIMVCAGSGVVARIRPVALQVEPE